MSRRRLSYELRLIVIGAIGAIVCVAGAWLAPATEAGTLEAFAERVQPIGRWPGPEAKVRRQAFWRRTLAFALILGAVYGMLFATRELFFGAAWPALALLAGAVAAGVGGWRVLEQGVRREADLGIGVEL